MSRMFLKPAPNLTILDPFSRRPLPPEGQWVEMENYWYRCLAVGDVTEAVPPADSAPENQSAPQESTVTMEDTAHADLV